MGPIPWTYNAEIHPLESKALGSSLAFTFNWVWTFVVTKFRPEMEDVMGTSGTHYLYGSCCAAGALFILLLLPETKGKSNDEIRRLFVSK